MDIEGQRLNDDKKSKLIEAHLDQGYDIEDETSNKITFTKEVKSILFRAMMGLLSNKNVTYSREAIQSIKKRERSSNLLRNRGLFWGRDHKG